jgi:hypothetical protein
VPAGDSHKWRRHRKISCSAFASPTADACQCAFQSFTYLFLFHGLLQLLFGSPVHLPCAMNQGRLSSPLH